MGRGSAAAALVLASLLSHAAPTARAAEFDYNVADPELAVMRLDRSETESFLAVTADSAGRLFVGGREALFVYEPNARGGWQQRRELYRLPPHSWIYDIAIRGDDVYLLTVSALYVLPGARLERTNLQAKRLVWGLPLGHVHQCFHGMALGPEGDIYFALGDPLWYFGDFQRPDHWGHWTFVSQAGAVKTPYTGVGGVLRCRPDGSRLEVFARGTRNSCGLAFDYRYHLFSNDNDHEGMPEGYVPGRLLHVTERSHFLWPRGWMVEKTPERADLLETMYGGLGRAVPVGQAYYNDRLLPARFRDALLVARWGKRTIASYPLRPRGASFVCDEQVLLAGQNHARPVGVSVGCGGRVFATIAYMAHNEASPVYPSDLVVISGKGDQLAQPYDGYEATACAPAKLWEELADPACSRRQAAHQEILRRGGPLLEQALERLEHAPSGATESVHLVWLAGASGSERARRLLAELAENSPDAVRRLGAVRALARFFDQPAAGWPWDRLLADPEPQVRHAAVVAAFRPSTPLPAAILTGPARSRDSYLRQAATLLIAERATFETIAALCRAPDAPGRLAGVLAAGFRLTLPPATGPIPPDLELAPHRSEEVYVIDFERERIDLRQYGPIGNFTIADLWKTTRRSAEQERLFSLLAAMLDDREESVRLMAAHFLYLLNDPRSEPAVAKVVKASDERRLMTLGIRGVQEVWLVGPFADGGQGFARAHPPEQGPIDLAADYPCAARSLRWTKQSTVHPLFDFRKLGVGADDASVYAYFRLESFVRQRALLLVGSDDGIKVWHNGRTAFEHDSERGALPFQDPVLLDLEPGGNDLLVRVRNRRGETGLYLHFRAPENIRAALPAPKTGATLAERLKAAGGDVAPGPEFLEVDWSAAAHAGDAGRGRTLFGADGLGCVKCHAVAAGQAGGGGPSLAEAAKRFTIGHLVESILIPSKEVSPIFRGTLVALKSGESLSGLVIGETGERIELLLPDGTQKPLLKSAIDVRRLHDLSPMPQGVVKTPQELGDLLAYLLSDNPAPP